MRIPSRSVAVFAGLLAAQAIVSTEPQFSCPVQRSDPRLLKLKGFFRGFDSPAYHLAEEFLVAADRNGLDWRLLPSISIVESGGGKAFANNNILGWDSCRKRFPSVAAGIDAVAVQLSESNLYKNKSLDELLAAYNPASDYAQLVKSLMTRLDPDDVPPAPR